MTTQRTISTNKLTRKQKLSRLTPWTAPWMHVRFNYTSYIEDDSHLTSEEKEKEPEIRNRVIAFANQRKHYRYELIGNNTRDLGGYETKNGHHIKTGLLIRSENLHNLNYFGHKVLERLHVNDIIDLRSLRESAHAKDRISQDIVHNDPVYTAKGVNRSRNLTFRYGVIYRYGTLFLTNWHAQHAYYKAIKLIENNNGGNLFHCVEGRDRTGLVAVLLLTLLGVDKQTIINDYLLTDYYAHTKPYIRQLKQINYFYKRANKLYGNIYGYLSHIGITTVDQAILRSKYTI